MYSRNKLRKEQQLLNLRQLSSKSSPSVRTDNDHKDHKEWTRDKHSSQSSPLQSSPNSMANRSPNQSSLRLTSNPSPIQSSKASIGSRGLCRTTRRDVNSGNDLAFGSQQVLHSKTETNPNMSLRSVNRSPTVRQQTLRSDRSVGLQSRPTHSPNSRSNVSLPQTLLSQSSTNCQNKQSLAKISDNSVNQRPIDSVIDNQTKQKSLSSSTSSSTTTKPEPNISPEILFLVKEQAKAIAAINSLQKKVDRLEQSIKNQDMAVVTDEMSNVSSTSTTKLVNNNSNNSKERIAISDDSGGEYSRATTTSDEDELSLLLDQIARRSQQLQSNTQLSNRFTNMSITSSSISGNNNNELLPQTMQIRPKWHTYVNPTVQMSHLTRSPTRETPTEHKLFGNYSKSGVTMTSSQPSSPPQASAHPSTHPSPGAPHTSISALLFEPNVENVLKNLDDIIANEPIDSNKFSNSSTISQTYQRSQTSLHSSHSLFDAMGVRAAGVSSGSLLPNNSSTSSSTNWVQLERAKSFVKQREEREVDQQMRLNDEWLQTQLRAQDSTPHSPHSPHNPHNHGFRRNNFIDSLEPSFR